MNLLDKMVPGLTTAVGAASEREREGEGAEERERGAEVFLDENICFADTSGSFADPSEFFAGFAFPCSRNTVSAEGVTSNFRPPPPLHTPPPTILKISSRLGGSHGR